MEVVVLFKFNKRVRRPDSPIRLSDLSLYYLDIALITVKSCLVSISDARVIATSYSSAHTCSF